MRLAVLVVLLASCRQIFGLHELADKKDAGSATSDGPGDGKLDAPTDAHADAPIDAPPDAYVRLSGIQCGAGSACDPNSQTCCWATGGHACQAPDSCSTGLADLGCDDATDCGANKFCCVVYDMTSKDVVKASCIPSGTMCAGGTGQAITYFCDPAGSQQCPNQQPCGAQSQLHVPLGYYECQ